MANEDIGYISRARLAAALPEQVAIRKSGRPGAKYPLYLSTPWGPWHMNTAQAQDVLLEGGVIGEKPAAYDRAGELARAPEPRPVAAPGGEAANDEAPPVAANDPEHTPEPAAPAKRADGGWFDFD